MSKKLNFVPQFHKNRNHISGQIWQTTLVMVMFLFEMSFIQRKITFRVAFQTLKVNR